MKTTRRLHDLHDLGQSLWLDNITRELLTSGTLGRYISDFAVTGLTSNPTIFDKAIKQGGSYDEAIREKTMQGKSGEELFYELALEDLIGAADLFRPIHDATGGVDGWVSLELSPTLADDTHGSINSAVQLHARAKRPNLFIKIPGTRKGIAAIEETIFAGVPVNVTLLFSREQYIATAEAYMRAIERRIAAGLDPKVDSVASLFVSRWDVAVNDKISNPLRNRLGIAIARRTYKAYRDLLASPRWLKLAASGARPQRFALGQHRHEGPGRIRDLVRGSARGSGYDQHYAGKDIACVRRARPGKRCAAARRRRRRRSGRRFCARRRQCRNAGCRSPAGGHRIFQQVVARSVGLHRIESALVNKADQAGRN